MTVHDATEPRTLGRVRLRSGCCPTIPQREAGLRQLEKQNAALEPRVSAEITHSCGLRRVSYRNKMPCTRLDSRTVP